MKKKRSQKNGKRWQKTWWQCDTSGCVAQRWTHKSGSLTDKLPISRCTLAIPITLLSQAESRKAKKLTMPHTYV